MPPCSPQTCRVMPLAIMRWKMGTPVAVTHASVVAASAAEQRAEVWRRRFCGQQGLTMQRCVAPMTSKGALERDLSQRQAGAALNRDADVPLALQAAIAAAMSFKQYGIQIREVGRPGSKQI